MLTFIMKSITSPPTSFYDLKYSKYIFFFSVKDWIMSSYSNDIILFLVVIIIIIITKNFLLEENLIDIY